MRNCICELKESTDALRDSLARMPVPDREFGKSSMVYEMMEHWIDINGLIISERLYVDDSIIKKLTEKTGELIQEI